MKTLNLVNGMVFYNKVLNGEIKLEGECVPFNESMCDGDATADIFGSDFRLTRSVYHLSTPEEYEEVVIDLLKPLFELDFDCLNMYFDGDMFCQINILTILAYLDKNGYDGEILLYLIDYEYTVQRQVSVKATGFYSVYCDVLIDKKIPSTILPDAILDAVIMYIDYAHGASPIHKYVKENLNLSQELLLKQLFENFAEYGLGDTQYLRLIDSIKGKY